MAKTVGSILNEIFGLVGIDASQPEFKDIIGIVTPVEDAIAEKISKNILTIEAAKMNGTLKSHFKAQTLNGVDAQHKELEAEYGLTPEEVAELDAVKDTFERNKKLVATIKANTAKLNQGKGDTVALVAANQKLNADLLAAKTASDATIAAMQTSHEGSITDYAIMSHLRALKYANATVDLDINALTAQNIIKAALAEKKALVKRGVDNSLKLVQAENPELDYLENHKPISFVDLAAKALQAKNMLEVNDPNARATGKASANQPPANGGGKEVLIDSTEAVNFYDQQIAKFQTG